ncbi:ABC transporter permease [Streptomyces paradoxus]|uniref:ABC transporter permease n=1 Tax=Streptomyces paradoxus TaxID=66375 RepID=UPI0037D51139
MFSLALHSLRHRAGTFVATLIAAYLGAVLIAACGGLVETSLRSEAPPQRLAAAPAVVAGEQRFEIAKRDPAGDKKRTRTVTLAERVHLDRDVADAISGVDGVRSVIPYVSFPARYGNTDLIGHSWESAGLTPYKLRDGRAPQTGEVVLDTSNARGIHLGDTIELAVQGTIEQFRVAGVATTSQDISESADVFFNDSDAARLYDHPGQVDAFGVYTDGDPKAIQDELGDTVSVLTGDARGEAEFPQQIAAAERLSPPFFASGGTAIAISLFVVANTLSLSLRQRQKEMAMLRSIGATPGQVRRMIIGEAVTIGVVAIAAAMATGKLLGSAVFDQLVHVGVVDEVIQYHQGVVPMAAAAVSTVLAMIGAALIAARRVTAVKPTEALLESAITQRGVSRFRIIGALVCFVGGGVFIFFASAVVTGPEMVAMAGPVVLLWCVGIAMISPVVVQVAELLLRKPVQVLTGVPGWLALANTRISAIRVASAVIPIVLAVGVTTANIYLQTTQKAVSQKAFADDLRAGAVVASPTGFSADTLQQIQRTKGVAQASDYVTSSVFVMSPFLGNQKRTGIPAVGLDGQAAEELNAARVVEGDLKKLAEGVSVALPDVLAAEMHRKVGDKVTLRLGDGRDVTMPIVATLDQREGYEQIVLPSSLLAEHTTLGAAQKVLVKTAPGVSDEEVVSRIQATLKDAPVTVGNREKLIEDQAVSDDVTAWVNYLAVAMMIGFVVVAVSNTLVMSTIRRRQEFGLQQLVGVTRWQIMRMVGIEGLLIAFIGILAGSAAAAGTTVPYSLATMNSLLPTGPPAVYATAVLGAVGLGIISVTIPAWVATRSRPVEAVAVGD